MEVRVSWRSSAFGIESVHDALCDQSEGMICFAFVWLRSLVGSRGVKVRKRKRRRMDDTGVSNSSISCL